MDWIKENKFLSGFIAVFVIGVVVLGYLLFSARSDYLATMEAYEQSANTTKTLSARPLYPEEDSLFLVREKAVELEQVVDDLQSKLVTFQKPLETDMDDREFQSKLTEQVIEVKTLAVRRGVELPADFSLGMERYTATLPRAEAVPELDYQLEALKFLTTTLIDNGALVIEEFNREPIDVETESAEGEGDAAATANQQAPAPGPAAAPAAPDVIKRYPVQVKFVSTPSGLEEILNTLANTPPESFYLAPRYLAIENESAEGPERGIPFEARIIEETLEPEVEELEDAPAEGDEPVVPAEGDEEGISDLITADESRVARVDSRIIMGNETVTVTGVIDLLRFEPVMQEEEEEGSAQAPGAGEEGA